MKRLIAVATAALAAWNSAAASGRDGESIGGDRAFPGRYTVIAWNDLGMHCMDEDYSVFAILPPYNNLRAQVIDRLTGKLVASGIRVTYQATPDTRGSINTTSKGKTNFWDWVAPTFGVKLPVDMGLAGNPVQSRKPAKMAYDPAAGVWRATGIPTVPYDDAGNANYYPMVKVSVQHWDGTVLASTRTVLPVSDELACSHCHASGTGDPAAQPSPDWVYDPSPGRDWKRNILLLHDNRNGQNPQYADRYATALAANGYSAAGLLATSDSGRPVLCANCHASNALGKPGVADVKQLTTSIHSWHATKAMDDNTGMPLGDTADRTGCYYCHPGSTTQCLRGVMGSAKNPDGSSKLECQSCHGSMYRVGADGRVGWIDLPSCQSCHYRSADGSYVRDTSALDADGNFREAESVFSTGGVLYKAAETHGNAQCESCHGSTHAEYATSEANDNAQSSLLQGHSGVVAECSVCHLLALPVTHDGGPHGLHTLGQLYVLTHGKGARSRLHACAVCHGSDYRGGVLSKTFTPRRYVFLIPPWRKLYGKGEVVGCYDCHDGPGWLIPSQSRSVQSVPSRSVLQRTVSSSPPVPPELAPMMRPDASRSE